MGVFIKSIGINSPQKTFDNSFLTDGWIAHPGNRFACIEPDYSTLIDAKQIRRMSRIVRMSVAASTLALKNAELDKPEAIIVGTAFGCLEDTDAFLSKMVQHKEEMLSPTSFIHSTHNTIAAQIALHFKCYGYNSTYVHRSVSFESALNDAMMLLEEQQVNNVLVGGADEITDASFNIMKRLSFFKNEACMADDDLYAAHSSGTIAGEGSAFFSLMNENSGNALAEILAVESISFKDVEEVATLALELLSSHQIQIPDVLLAGFNGDKNEDLITGKFCSLIGMENKIMKYKHLCGDYATSSSFALWLAASIYKNKQLLPVAISRNGNVNNILIYNQTGNKHHSIILVRSC